MVGSPAGGRRRGGKSPGHGRGPLRALSDATPGAVSRCRGRDAPLGLSTDPLSSGGAPAPGPRRSVSSCRPLVPRWWRLASGLRGDCPAIASERRTLAPGRLCPHRPGRLRRACGGRQEHALRRFVVAAPLRRGPGRNFRRHPPGGLQENPRVVQQGRARSSDDPGLCGPCEGGALLRRVAENGQIGWRLGRCPGLLGNAFSRDPGRPDASTG